jgi:membrane fusion protein (multidrug efflux system)
MSRSLLASLLLLAAAAATACGRSDAADTTATAPPPAPEVAVVTVESRPVTLVTELPGRTAPYGIAEVRPQVNGLILKRLFTEGTDVKAGTVLYQIDPAPYQAALDAAKASLARSEANLVAARLRAERYKGLVAINAVSQQDYDDAVAALGQIEASIAADKAAIRTAEINLGYTQVRSPIAGRIGRSSVTPGALVTANQADALAVVQQLDPIYVDLTQSSAELLRLRRDLAEGRLKSDKGQAVVRLLLEDGTPYDRTGRLQFSEVSVDERTGAVTLRAVFPNPDGVLLPGMYVRAVMEEGTKVDGLLVPQQAVTRDPKGGATTLVVTPDDMVEMRQIEATRAVGDQWLVTSGLEAGERVIVEGIQRVRPGIQVRVAPLQAAEPATDGGDL